MFSQNQVIKLVAQTIEALENSKILFSTTVGVSNRHVHLCRRDIDILFGKGYEPTLLKQLSQPGECAYKETVLVAGPKGAIPKVRVLGPPRKNTQIELLRSDSFVLGIKLPVNHSGSNEVSPEITLIGPKGTVVVDHGVMAAWRHIHMPKDFAKSTGFEDGDTVSVKTKGNRAVTFDNVNVRVGNFVLELHLDVDEANSAGLSDGDKVEVGLL